MIKIYKNFTPLVSVILPSYNRAEFLERSIASVLNQSIKELELLIIDDGSYDNTFEIVQSFIKNYPNIRYMHHVNRGVTLSMNAGIKTSVGEYITFLGSDDEYKENHIELRLKYFQYHPEVDLIHGGAEIIGDQYVYDKNDLSKKIHLSECILGGTLFGKRNVFEKVGGFNDLAYSGESDLYERCEKMFTIHKVDMPTYIYYRDGSDSITKNII